MSSCSSNCNCTDDKCSGETCACSEKDQTNPLNNVKNVIAVMSGKGGVGKSTVTALLASSLQKKGFKVGVLDADITGPSIPMLFGTTTQPEGTELGMLPVKSATGIQIMSINLLLPHEDDPVIWRGPIISGVIKQFWEEVIWGDLDYLLVDLPPGTGDAPLTVLQSIPLKGVVIVTSPQDLANMVVRKAINMADKMDIPVLGLVENMSYIQCPGCKERIYPFGKGKTEKMAQKLNIPLLGILPLNPAISEKGDQGEIEQFNDTQLKLQPLLEQLSS